MNPVQARFNPTTMRLFIAEGEIVAREGQLKCGVFSLEIVEEIPVPTLTNEQRVKLAILCAKAVYTDSDWRTWADRWLDDEDRSTEEAARMALEIRSLPTSRNSAVAERAAWAAAHTSGGLVTEMSAAETVQRAVRAAAQIDLIALLNQL